MANHRHQRRRRHFKTQDGQAQAFENADAALQQGWNQLRITREWEHLLNSLQNSEQRTLLLRPGETKSKNEKE